MSTGADVNSFAVLHDWYAALTVFRTEGRDALTTLTLALQHCAAWLDEQQQYWHREIRASEDAVTEAKTELRERKMFPDAFGHTPDCTVQEKNLLRAKARLRAAEERLEMVRRWALRLPRDISAIYDGAANHLSHFLEADLPAGQAQLARQLTALEQYANLRVTPLAAPTVAVKPEKEPS
jgi:hypothetical protein